VLAVTVSDVPVTRIDCELGYRVSVRPFAIHASVDNVYIWTVVQRTGLDSTAYLLRPLARVAFGITDLTAYISRLYTAGIGVYRYHVTSHAVERWPRDR